MSKTCLMLFSTLFTNFLQVSSTPQYYVTPEDAPFRSNIGGNSWQNYNRYGVSSSQAPIQYYPSSATPNAYDNIQSGTFYQNPPSNPPLGYYPQQSAAAGPGSPTTISLTPSSLDALLMRPLLVIDSQVFAMYQLIKCWELNGELKKCVKLIEKLEKLFKKKGGGDDDDDGDKKKGKKGKKGKGKKGKRSKKRKNSDSESVDSREDDDEDNDDEEDEDADEDDEQDD